MFSNNKMRPINKIVLQRVCLAMGIAVGIAQYYRFKFRRGLIEQLRILKPKS